MSDTKKYKITLVSKKGYVMVDVNGSNTFFYCDISDKVIGQMISLPESKKPVIEPESSLETHLPYPKKEGVSNEKRNRKDS